MEKLRFWLQEGRNRRFPPLIWLPGLGLGRSGGTGLFRRAAGVRVSRAPIVARALPMRHAVPPAWVSATEPIQVDMGAVAPASRLPCGRGLRRRVGVGVDTASRPALRWPKTIAPAHRDRETRWAW